VEHVWYVEGHFLEYLGVFCMVYDLATIPCLSIFFGELLVLSQLRFIISTLNTLFCHGESGYQEPMKVGWKGFREGAGRGDDPKVRFFVTSSWR